ncbi:sulfotransferase family protein [Salinispora arenicola]|uniref:sulfotransferase family protein n=1 Tax=Salinispora arenicola TaxID=168697 RepID=UPI00037E3696|nr:sulfotransferase [Salinispora arenicola]NIL57887.1 sulfotransferase [Salinispora arenicola]NIL63992.1 sulfotransferase [Salinispora arenicola]
MTAGIERLVASPVFVLSSIRSGSTLLRCILNSHPHVHAPYELHLVDLSVHLDSPFAHLAMQVAGLDNRQLEHLLWDRLLHRELTRSGKRLIVDKTPTNVLRWQRVAECWPQARYVFLLRHPLRVVQSAIVARPHATPAESTDLVRLFLARLDEARRSLSGVTIRYEDLTRRPEQVVRGLCGDLGVEWDPGMLDYGRYDHGPFRAGIGDFTERIRAGRVLPGRPNPTEPEIPEELRSLCRRLGYL